jgi:hypothetical protein
MDQRMGMIMETKSEMRRKDKVTATRVICIAKMPTVAIVERCFQKQLLPRPSQEMVNTFGSLDLVETYPGRATVPLLGL